MDVEGLDDEALAKALAAHSIPVVPITSSTRAFLVRKLQRAMNQNNGAGSDKGVCPSTNTPEPEASALTESSPGGYYGVIRPPGTPNRPEMSPYYTSKAEALKAMKSYGPGARFKKFDSPVAAEAYSTHPSSFQEYRDTHSSPQPVSERSNQYPSVKTPDLSRLRKMIEEGRVAEFTDTVWSNPRYLITSGDTPEILHVGQRHNALHVAANKGNLAACREILAIIESSRFWELVYCDDTLEVQGKRKAHLIDLYLNTHDKIVSLFQHTKCNDGHDRS